jgi:hypothetical protein
MNGVVERSFSMSSPVGTTPDSYPPPPLPPAAVTLVTARPPKRPVLAMVLSVLFPGTGQLYNGQTSKAFALFAAFVGSIYLAAEVDGMPFGFFIPFAVFYAAIDAYRSAVMINLRAAGRPPESDLEDDEESPAWGIVLLGIGLVLLMNNLGILEIAAVRRFWPLILVAVGLVFLRRAMKRREAAAAAARIDDGPVV